MAPSRPTRVLILSAHVGEGHISAARALAQALQLVEGVEASVVNSFAVLGERLARRLERGFHRHLAPMDLSYHLVYHLFMRCGLARRAAARALFHGGALHLARFVEERRPDVLVSTYPVITTVLGELRSRALLQVPTCAVITDMSGLRFWAHRGIDMHLAMYECSLAEIEQIAGPGRARQVRPLVASEFFACLPRRQARRALGLPEDRPLVLVSGGGWAVGELEDAARAALALPDASVIVLSGRDEAKRLLLSERLAGEPRAEVWGFSERMSELLAAASAFVDTTSGVTCLEAQVRGCPTICYGRSRAHIRVNARALARHGNAEVARTAAELSALLAAAVERPRSPCPGRWRALPGAAEIVLDLALRARQGAAQAAEASRAADAAVDRGPAAVDRGPATVDRGPATVAAAVDRGPTTAATTRD